MTYEPTTLEFPGAVLRRAGATKTDVLAIEARWTGATEAERQDMLDHLDSLDEVGLRAELREIIAGLDDLTTDNMHGEPAGGDDDPLVAAALGRRIEDTDDGPGVKTYARNHPERVSEMLRQERAGANRSTLITYLESFGSEVDPETQGEVPPGTEPVESPTPPPGVPDSTEAPRPEDIDALGAAGQTDDEVKDAEVARLSEVLAGNRDAVIAYARAHPDDAANLSELEKGGQGRATVLTVLDGLVVEHAPPA